MAHSDFVEDQIVESRNQFCYSRLVVLVLIHIEPFGVDTLFLLFLVRQILQVVGRTPLILDLH